MVATSIHSVTGSHCQHRRCGTIERSKAVQKQALNAHIHNASLGFNCHAYMTKMHQNIQGCTPDLSVSTLVNCNTVHTQDLFTSHVQKGVTRRDLRKPGLGGCRKGHEIPQKLPEVSHCLLLNLC